MSIILRELLDDITHLRNFAIVNSGNDIGQKLNRILDYASKCLDEEKVKEEKIKQEIIRTNQAYTTSNIVTF